MTNEEYLSVVKDLSTLNMYLKNHPLDEAIDELEDKILTNQYRIAVVGDFSSGKSTFINALIGEELLYNSTIEATGVITTIQYGDQPIAEICRKKNSDIADEIIEKIELSNDDGRIRLNQFLDIRNELGVDQINIYYPISGVDKNIVFFDTPGIEKLSQQQMMMTKKIISEVNAVIFLITKKGFTKPSLKVISGEHEIIGKIPSKDIMVVMTHIGEIFDEKKNVDPNLQIEKSVCEAKGVLREKGLDDIAVIPLDSRDYLWGTSIKSYIKERETRDEKLKGPLLEQSEYRKRSRFDDFKTILYRFLEKDNLMRSRELDIESTIISIADDIETKLRIQHEDGNRNQIILKNQLDKQMELACENQRKFYNRMMQQLQGHMEDFFQNVERDVESKKRQEEEIILHINDLFKTLDEITEENVNSCIAETMQDIEVFARYIESETNKHLKITSESFISSCFSEQFQKIFDKEIDVNIQDISYDFSLILKKDDYDVESVINDSDVEEIKEEKKSEERALAQAKKLFEESNVSLAEANNAYQKQKEELDNWYSAEIKKLGTRPKAKQKYQEVTKTKGILFWKKTWTEKVPDGMDHSAGINWDRKQRDLMVLYEKKCDSLDVEYDCLEQQENSLKRYRNAISEHTSKIKRLENKIHKYMDYIDAGKRKYTEAYISEKKEEVASLCDTIRVDLVNQICESVRVYINKRKKAMESSIKDELKRQMSKYQEELNEKNRLLSESIQVTSETQETALNNIVRIKEIISNGKAV